MSASEIQLYLVLAGFPLCLVSIFLTFLTLYWVKNDQFSRAATANLVGFCLDSFLVVLYVVAGLSSLGLVTVLAFFTGAIWLFCAVRDYQRQQWLEVLKKCDKVSKVLDGEKDK